MIRRSRRGVPAAIAATLVLAVMIAVVWSSVRVLIGQTPLMPVAYVMGLRWNELPVLIGGGVLAALGLVLLAGALIPGKPNVLPLAGQDRLGSAGVTRRSLSRSIAAAAEGVDGVSRATAQVATGRVTAAVRTSLPDATGLPELVQDAVGARLTAVDLQRPPTIRVRVNRSRST